MKRERTTARLSSADDALGHPEPDCFFCDDAEITTRLEPHSWKHGVGEGAVTLHVDLPVHRCENCGHEFVGPEGETIQHEAVCRHFGVLTPAEVRQVRQRRARSRREFARCTGLGEATLQRWEHGAIIQNPANDNYLRLADTDFGWAMLNRLACRRAAGRKAATAQNVLAFRHANDLRRRRSFTPRPTRSAAKRRVAA